ncbi:hypothetical protein L1987_50415 [Smallanthus sonchifolius]|uniref:Uncharacterized protein n=1 Tax=Smallanthus sonchifolius TaxID=185202 RepID=A0ACB9EMF0_9ASTR|nr:hypothetical protein L1987_50415 [Smallanthus sonchifolius]
MEERIQPVGYFLLQLEHGHQMSVGPMELWLKVANLFRGSGWPDGAVVFALATLPVIELRGAIHVGYWLQLNPVLLTALPILGLLHFPNIIFITYAVDYG